MSKFVVCALQALAVLALASTTALALDNFPGTTLTGTSGSVAGSNTGLTGQTGEPQIVDGSAANIHSFWYSWTAPSAGLFTIATCNPTGITTTNYDTTLGTYTGAAVNALTQIAANDDTTDCQINGGGTLGSSNSFTTVSGTTYRFRVDGYQAAQGNYLLNWGFAALTVSVTDSVTSEAPGLADTGAFTVRLNSPVAGGSNTTVTIGASSPAGQCTFAPSTLTFTPSNWQTVQTVTVTAVNDATVEGIHNCRPATITATGGGYTTTTSSPTPIFTINDDENPAFTITKAVSAANISAPGVLTYTITIDNTGNALLTSPVITDAMTFNGGALALTSGPTLTSGDTNSNGRIEDTEIWVYTATATATQAHFDGTGNYSNTATFDTLETTASTSAAAVTTLTRTATFTIGKIQNSGPSPITAAGQTIGYRVTVTNTGTQTLTGTAFADTFQLNGVARALTTGPTLSGDLDSDTQLDVGEIWLYNATYVVPQTDIDGTGSFTNVATFDTAQTPLSTSPTVTTPVTRTASFTIGKVQFAGPNPVTAAGQTLTYRVTVTNTGNQTLTVPVFTDTFQLNGAARTLATGPTLSGDTDTDGQVDLTEVWLYTATYVVPQTDIDGTGSFTNVATFDTAQTPLSTSPTVTTPVTRTASFSILKAQSGGPNPVTAHNQTISYLITVQNTGNQTLTGLLMTDTLLQGASARTLATGPVYASGDTDSDGGIDTTEIWLYNATYIVSLSDMNNGSTFSNTASLDTTQTALQTSAAVTTPITQTPLITMTKTGVYLNSGDDVNGNGFADAGDLVTYQYVVSNGGNVTITNISVADIHNGIGTLSSVTPATVASLAPSTNTTFQATYIVKQGDVDAQ